MRGSEVGGGRGRGEGEREDRKREDTGVGVRGKLGNGDSVNSKYMRHVLKLRDLCLQMR